MAYYFLFVLLAILQHFAQCAAENNHQLDRIRAKMLLKMCQKLKTFSEHSKFAKRFQNDAGNGCHCEGWDGTASITIDHQAIKQMQNGAFLQDVYADLVCPHIDYLENNTTCLPMCINEKAAVDMRFPNLGEIAKKYPDMGLGGHWKPKECKSISRVAIIVPYRNREMHLRGFLLHMHAFLQRQQLDYAIYIVEEYGELTFNRGRLLNIGFLESQKISAWDCFAFHDIDTVPQNNLNFYNCPQNPRTVKRMVTGFEKLNYSRFYDNYFSGALIFGAEGYRAANGFSNDYWGWGGEDDDLFARVKHVGLNILENEPQIGHYKTFDHKQFGKGWEPNECRWKLLQGAQKRQPRDGLGNINYSIKFVNQSNSLYTHIMVDILEEEFREWKKENVCP